MPSLVNPSPPSCVVLQSTFLRGEEWSLLHNRSKWRLLGCACVRDIGFKGIGQGDRYRSHLVNMVMQEQRRCWTGAKVTQAGFQVKQAHMYLGECLGVCLRMCVWCQVDGTAAYGRSSILACASSSHQQHQQHNCRHTFSNPFSAILSRPSMIRSRSISCDKFKRNSLSHEMLLSFLRSVRVQIYFMALFSVYRTNKSMRLKINSWTTNCHTSQLLDCITLWL